MSRCSQRSLVSKEPGNFSQLFPNPYPHSPFSLISFPRPSQTKPNKQKQTQGPTAGRRRGRERVLVGNRLYLVLEEIWPMSMQIRFLFSDSISENSKLTGESRGVRKQNGAAFIICDDIYTSTFFGEE